MSIWGAMAELALAIPKYTVKLPSSMSFAEGAAMWLNYSTAHLALERAGESDRTAPDRARDVLSAAPNAAASLLGPEARAP
jgi:NADPH:quinone reductase-like Zn-dependent oxidoreductase